MGLRDRMVGRVVGEEGVVRAGFWEEFDRVAPWSVRVGAWVVAVWVAVGLPLIWPLAEVGKVVACLAYFDDEQVQRRVRGDGGGEA